MFTKILIANRAEIACRVIRTAREMNIATVAVYSDADANALHVKLADEAVHIGGSASKDSYLRGDNIIQAALDTGAQAIHPGYGFLSENAGFVRAVKQAGLVFIGPDIQAIKVMGDKIESKSLAIKSGVSCVPGSDGEVNDLQMAMKAAEEIGYPVMIKASAGGGGKGMRVISHADKLEEGMQAAKTEAQNAFGDDRVFVEKFVTSPRHIEIQILGDQHGHLIYLGERECSVQRRHQKVIEEAPSSFISAETRRKMGEEAVELARAVGYFSAGTVEFIVGANQDFYFLEMNTRLQVEHPVTEQVYGIDLVEWMIKIAAGQALTLIQKEIKPKGWSIEARLYAEDSARGFLPSTGQLRRYVEPEGKGIRADSGVSEGGMISVYYDPMIAKLVATGADRKQAIDRLRLALGKYQIAGVATNRQFLISILDDVDFQAGQITTGFIAEKYGTAFTPKQPDEHTAMKLTALGVAIYARAQARLHDTGGGHMQAQSYAIVNLDEQIKPNLDEQIKPNKMAPQIAHWQSGQKSDDVRIGDQLLDIEGHLDQPLPRGGIIINGLVDQLPMIVQLEVRDHHFILYHGAERLSVSFYPAHAAPFLVHMPEHRAGVSETQVTAPMPGLLTRLMVSEGDFVEAGQDVAAIEAMKMENTLTAQMAGVVDVISAPIGASVNVDDLILTLRPHKDKAKG